VHCKGGVGRAGLVAACVLLATEAQSTAADAIAEVRRRRCKTAVETTRQEEFVAKYEAWMRAGEAGGEAGDEG
jgi:cyclin-dependent kinase inhibitor 3